VGRGTTVGELAEGLTQPTSNLFRSVLSRGGTGDLASEPTSATETTFIFVHLKLTSTSTSAPSAFHVFSTPSLTSIKRGPLSARK